MAKKVTKTEMFNRIKAQLTNADEIAFIDHEIELVTKKNANKSSKPTKRQTENADIKTAIYDGMVEGERYTVGELIKAVPALEGYSNQKVSALLRQMKEDDLVERVEEKRVAYFSKIVADVEGDELL